MAQTIDEFRAERDAAIIAEWKARNRLLPPYRVMTAIATQMGMTAQGIEKILRKHGVYTRKRHYNKKQI